MFFGAQRALLRFDINNSRFADSFDTVGKPLDWRNSNLLQNFIYITIRATMERR
jgi:hypothetical protein